MEILVSTLEEFLDKAVAACRAVVFEIFEIFHNMALLFPEVHQFLEFHLTLHVKNVLSGKILNISVSFKFLSNLGLDLVCRNI